MGMLVDGEWTDRKYNFDDDGRFKRRPTTFRERVAPEDVAAGRYHLYVSYACPWANRTLIVRALRGLESAISVSVVDHFMGEDGWRFGHAGTPDHINGKDLMHQVYTAADPGFTGNVTVPVLWDKEAGTIVNNESREIIHMFDTVFDPICDGPSLRPKGLEDDIDAVIDAIYEPINNGVYRSGFARSQTAHAEAVTELFEHLEHWEVVLEGQRYVCGDVLTEADVCLFTTLIRFDPVYHTHFKCNLKRITDFPNLWGFTRELYQMPAVMKTVDFDHIKQHYYRSHESVNPRRLVPLGPLIDYTTPHGRDRF